MIEVREKLLSRILRLEQAAKRGLQINTEFAPSLEKGSVISVESCNTTLKDCGMFRKWVNECFGSSESTPVPTSHAPE
jgi:hypothetical protein